MLAAKNQNGQYVQQGDTIVDPDGDKWMFVSVMNPKWVRIAPEEGKGGSFVVPVKYLGLSVVYKLDPTKVY